MPRGATEHPGGGRYTPATAQYCSMDHSRIRCDDTDVLVLLLYYSSKGMQMLANEVYKHAGHSDKIVRKERYIPFHQISSKLGNSICHCLQRCTPCQDAIRRVPCIDLENVPHTLLLSTRSSADADNRLDAFNSGQSSPRHK